MKQSLRERILSYYQRHAGVWISGGEVERLVSQKTTYKSSNASRRLRELAEDGLLERKDEGGHVWYKYIPQKKVIDEVKIIGDRAVIFKKTVMA